ncbi:MAG: response regulator [Pseudomonadota bacterium]
MDINHVLIVDDNENMLNALNRLLKVYFKNKEAADNLILTASSVGEAITILNKTPSVMIVITDIMMPEIDGIDFLRYITHELRRGIQVIMMTGQSTMSRALDSLRNGAVDYLTKPFDVETLDDVMDKTITRLEKWEKIIRGDIPGCS